MYISIYWNAWLLVSLTVINCILKILFHTIKKLLVQHCWNLDIVQPILLEVCFSELMMCKEISSHVVVEIVFILLFSLIAFSIGKLVNVLWAVLQDIFSYFRNAWLNLILDLLKCGRQIHIFYLLCFWEKKYCLMIY